MSHFTVTVVVCDADSPASAIKQANAMMEPYDEAKVTPQAVTISTREVERILSLAAPDDLARKSLEDVTADPASREVLLRVLGEYTTGHPDHAFWDGEAYGYRTMFNPEARWDGHRVGGNYQGFYNLKEGVAEADYRLGGPAGIDLAPDEALMGRADVARKRSIDIEGMRLLAGIDASNFYDQYEAATAGIEPPEPWGRTVARAIEKIAARETVSVASAGAGSLPSDSSLALPALPGDIDTISEFEAMRWAENTLQAMQEQSMFVAVSEVKAETIRLRRDYNAHPWVMALADARLYPMFSSPHELFKVGEGEREALIQSDRDSALMTRALLTEDGWMERGKMLMFGLSKDTMSREDWVTRFNEVIDGLPDDAWLVLLDAHC